MISLFGKSDFGDGLLKIGAAISSRDVLLNSRIDANPNANSSAVPASYEIRAASSSGFTKNFKTWHKPSTKRDKTSKMDIWSDAAKASLKNMPVLNLKVIASSSGTIIHTIVLFLVFLYWCFLNITT